MIYTTCTQAAGVEVQADGRELVEVRWVRFGDLGALLPQPFDPVRDHTEGRLGWQLP